MYYDYYCSNPNCDKKDTVQTITKPMSESSRKEYCLCGEELHRTLQSLVCGMSIDNTGSFYRKVN